MFKVFFALYSFLLTSFSVEAQNVLKKTLKADDIETIVINGNQIFRISVSTKKTDVITITSTLDGEYQNEFQITTEENDKKLTLSLEHLSLNTIADDKRNAHKVIAATLYLQIPEELNLTIKSDVGSVDLKGDFKVLSVELLNGHFEFTGKARAATVNTIDGDIKVLTSNATVSAYSNHGQVKLDEFAESNSNWKLRSINGNISVVQQE